MNKLIVMMIALVAIAMNVSAVTAYTNAPGGTAEFSVLDKGGTYKLTGYLDLSKQALGSGDSMAVINIPANCVVQAVELMPIKLTTTAVTLSVGDTGSATRFIGATVISNMTAGVGSISAHTTTTAYTAANQIILTAAAAASGSTGIVKVTAVIADLK